jgi:hypothetical protein
MGKKEETSSLSHGPFIAIPMFLDQGCEEVKHVDSHR